MDRSITKCFRQKTSKYTVASVALSPGKQCQHSYNIFESLLSYVEDCASINHKILSTLLLSKKRQSLPQSQRYPNPALLGADQRDHRLWNKLEGKVDTLGKRTRERKKVAHSASRTKEMFLQYCNNIVIILWRAGILRLNVPTKRSQDWVTIVRMLRRQIRYIIYNYHYYFAFSKEKRVGVSLRLVYTKYNLVTSDEFEIKDSNTEKEWQSRISTAFRSKIFINTPILTLIWSIR